LSGEHEYYLPHTGMSRLRRGDVYKKASGKHGRMLRTKRGFTVIELLVVMILGLIILAGLVTILTSAFDVFRSSSDLEAITDSARRTLSSMSRQIKGAVYLDDTTDPGPPPVPTACNKYKFTFYSDIDSDNPAPKLESKEDYATIGNYIDKVQFTAMAGALVEKIWKPAGAGSTEANLGSYVKSVEFHYFMPGQVPIPRTPPNTGYENEYEGTEKNANVGMVRIVLTLQKGKVSRTLTQDAFLRVIDRTAE